ncbi:MAG: hypothetical protein KBH11_07565 [Bacteroidia bacterium]|nr:hypothetical protein [Bacteroidia bacterium]
MKKIRIISRLIPFKAIYLEFLMQRNLVQNPTEEIFPSEFTNYPDLAAYLGPYLSDCMQS